MFFPIRTDRRLTRIPWVNYGLIALNVIIFLFTFSDIDLANQILGELYRLTAQGVPQSDPRILALNARLEQIGVLDYFLEPRPPQLHQYISYQFLHAGWMHLIGNMVFLYVFGSSVEDRLGHIGYGFFYLAGGVLAGLAHALLESSPVLGASGAVAGVTGAFLALFPMSNITVVYFFFIIGAVELPGMIVIGLQIAMNVFFQLTGGGGNTAYLAHLAGYAHGLTIGMSLLLAGVLPREPYDMLALWAQRRRRGQFRKMARQGYAPWDHNKPPEPSARQEAPPLDAEQQKMMQQRAAVLSAINQHDMPNAAKRYRALLEAHADQVLGQQAQLDVANQLTAEGEYQAAAQAYELFLKHYPTYSQHEQVQLILALVYARYLGRRDRARELLQAASPRLSGSDQALAQQVRNELA